MIPPLAFNTLFSKSIQNRLECRTRYCVSNIPKGFSLAKVAKVQGKMDQHIGHFAHDHHICSRIRSRGPQCKSMDKNIFDPSLQHLRDLGYIKNNGISPKDLIQRHQIFPTIRRNALPRISDAPPPERRFF